MALSLPTVSDTQDPNPTVTNNAPANGFPVGTTIVIWRATDYSGNHGTAEQKIVIEDKSPPLLVAPSNILAEASGVKTSVSLGTPIVSDLVDLYPFVSNDAPLGYAIGNSTVTWKAKDASGNSVTASQTVTIVDTTPPTIVAPADIMINSTGALTPISIGSAVANDRVDPASDGGRDGRSAEKNSARSPANARSAKKHPCDVQRDESGGGADEPGQQVPGQARERLPAIGVTGHAKDFHSAAYNSSVTVRLTQRILIDLNRSPRHARA